MHDAGVQTAGRDGVQAEEPILAVEVYGPEVLSGFPAEGIKRLITWADEEMASRGSKYSTAASFTVRTS
jgi:hypothetical protein